MSHCRPNLANIGRSAKAVRNGRIFEHTAGAEARDKTCDDGRSHQRTGQLSKIDRRRADGVEFSKRIGSDSSFIHFFTTRRDELEKQLMRLRENFPDTGTFWVSWPKKSAGVPSDVTEDVIRAVALPLGFVDVKVCAVDETWSGLKLVIRRTHRKLPTTK